ncbi:putative short internodesfamily transcription factor [Carex littledalei]|uniref:Putative short internodesfamily transcription factor n=1 Tax=Carex littledalei TaxID=544730 RepID=A0A833QS48_9POAL|nr:putative short internodesfamily transcription factor [Carex littledalei]
MAGFHLGGGGPTTTRTDTSPVPTESIFLYARTSSRTGGFQLWPPNTSLQHHPQFFSPGATSPSPATVLSFSHEPTLGATTSSGARAGTSCQDCGNNAKKDCIHLRCRTCCRSRGFHCSTHVKSTWVPAAKRRERQHQLAQLLASGTSGGSSEGTKRARDPTGLRVGRMPTVVATTSSSGDGGRFPAEVSSEAVFRCVKIGPLDEADEDELAYQTAISIGGHVFKGILRNHGPETADYNQLHGGDPASSPSVAAATSNEAGGGVGGSHAATSTAAVLMDPYPTPLGAFMQGTQFFPHQPRN